MKLNYHIVTSCLLIKIFFFEERNEMIKLKSDNL